ncbi:hypothetical protein C8Q79DRAFT_927254 [Trametes meyenii]|nr:hypothetical protein C8Q79DRAFT_927254 [Trametes meyenii]
MPANPSTTPVNAPSENAHHHEPQPLLPRPEGIARVPVFRKVTIVSQPNVREAKAAPLWRLNTSVSAVSATSPVVVSPSSIGSGLNGSPSTPRVSARVARRGSLVPPLGSEGPSGTPEEPEGAVGRGMRPSPIMATSGTDEVDSSEEADVLAKNNSISGETSMHAPSPPA